MKTEGSTPDSEGDVETNDKTEPAGDANSSSEDAMDFELDEMQDTFRELKALQQKASKRCEP